MLKSDFEEHPIWEKLKLATEAAELLLANHPNDERSTNIAKSLEYLEWTIKKTDHVFLSSSALDTIANTNLNNIIGYLSNDANNFGYFSHIENQFTEIFKVLPYPQFKKVQRADARSLILETQQKADELKNELLSLKNETRRAKQDFSSNKEVILDDIKRAKARFDELELELENSYEKAESLFEAEISTKNVEFSERFSKAQTDRSEDYQKLKELNREEISKVQEAIAKLNSDNKEMLATSRQQLNNYSQEVAKDSNALLATLRDTVSQAGQDALAAGISGAAEEERKIYSRFMLAAFCLILAAAILLGQKINLQIENGQINFLDLLKNLPLSTILFLPALYIIPQANDHRKSAKKLRSLGLRIQAFEAYTTSYDLVDKNDLKVKMADEFFKEVEKETHPKKLFTKSSKFSSDEILDLLDKLASSRASVFGKSPKE